MSKPRFPDDYVLQRDPSESDADYAARCNLFYPSSSFYDELLDLVLAGYSITAIKRVLADGRAGVSLAEAKRWVEDFTVQVAVPIARGERPRREPVVVGIPGVMGGVPCISGTRIPAALVDKYRRDGATEDEARVDYPTLPKGAYEAVRRWREGQKLAGRASG